MAKRRMLSNRITTTARFLKMPPSSQALYFHLCIHADDDGIVEAYPVMQSVGSNEDDIKILATKDFVKVLNDDLVTFILDWREHNMIRPDRKIDSIYKDLLLQIIPNANLVTPEARSDVKDNRARLSGIIGGPSTDRPRTSHGPLRLGKDRVSKENKDKEAEKPPTPSEDAIDFFGQGVKYFELLDLFSKDRDRTRIEMEFKKFGLYWTEPNKTGTKVRWQQQPTFEVKRRLIQWLTRANQYSAITKEHQHKEIIA